MGRSSLPPELRGAAIRTSTGVDHGVSRKRLRADDVQHPFHAVSSVDLDPSSVRDLATAFLPVMEDGQVFSHVTALALHGVPLPDLPPELHVSVRFPRTPPRRPGIRGHSLSQAPAILLDGMPVAPPVVAWAQSGALLSRDDLVAAGDRLLFEAPDRASDIAEIAARWLGRPGHARLLWAAPRLRHGVRARPESHLRLLLVRRRLPEPVVAPSVLVAGGRVLHPDLAYLREKLALEYEGDGHRSRAQWERDIERREWLADAGWRTLRVTSRQLYRDPESLVARVRRHLRL